MQYYMVVKPEDKLNVLYSFLKTHHKQKVIIFASTCKQVRFVYESFRKFRLSSPLYELQGHQKQKKRMAIYFTFCEKQYGILVCTNIASRGLDFPMVDWVIQLDIPEDAETYVHRVGRTARFKYEGKSLAFASEHELEFINNLKAKNIKIHKITQNPEKYFKIDSSLQSICSEHQDVKYLAQRALISYIQFVYKASNKSIFNIKNLNL
jgi:ATP-dependent RNA helicase DDX10/DBP4